APSLPLLCLLQGRFHLGTKLMLGAMRGILPDASPYSLVGQEEDQRNPHETCFKRSTRTGNKAVCEGRSVSHRIFPHITINRFIHAAAPPADVDRKRQFHAHHKTGKGCRKTPTYCAER